MQTFIGLLTALLGSAGFALIFNVRKQLLPLAALGLCLLLNLLSAGIPALRIARQQIAASLKGEESEEM